MRVLAVTPISVSAEELARRQARYHKLCPDGVTVHLANLGDGSEVPRALETQEDIVASESAVLRWYSGADLHGVDALLPDCVLDPAVGRQEQLPLPVHGIGRLSAYFLAGLGLRATAVARNQAIADELDRRLASYGLPLHRPTAVLGLTVEDIADDATWAAAVERTVAGTQSDAVINACSAVDITRHPAGPVLVDPTATALRMLATQAEVGR